MTEVLKFANASKLVLKLYVFAISFNTAIRRYSGSQLLRFTLVKKKLFKRARDSRRIEIDGIRKCLFIVRTVCSLNLPKTIFVRF